MILEHIHKIIRMSCIYFFHFIYAGRYNQTRAEWNLILMFLSATIWKQMSCYSVIKQWKKVKRVRNPDCEWDTTCKTNMAATTSSTVSFLSFLDFLQIIPLPCRHVLPNNPASGSHLYCRPVTLFLLLLRNICPEVSRFFLFDVCNSNVLGFLFDSHVICSSTSLML